MRKAVNLICTHKAEMSKGEARALKANGTKELPCDACGGEMRTIMGEPRPIRS